MRSTANCYDQGLAEIDHLMREKPVSVEGLPGKLSRIAATLHRAAECERKTGEESKCCND